MARAVGEIVAETLWPTRCALCDAPGAVLCPACAAQLPAIDWWRACPRCGSAFGAVQCDLCNPVSLARIGRAELPFRVCASAVAFTEDTGQLVRIFKDQGEQRLARVMAWYMAKMVAPSWRFEAITFVPATLAAFRHRGFDHCELLARELAAQLDVPFAPALARPRIRDQRGLTANARIRNLNGAFTATAEAAAYDRLLLVDDVFTTGSTMCAATDALLAAGASQVSCLTFARV